MRLTNEPMAKAIIKTNRSLLYKSLGSLRKEGIKRIWNGEHSCKNQIREAVRRKGCAGGWTFFFDYDGVMRPTDKAVQFAGSNGVRQEREVATRILEALRSAGLTVHWQGSLKKKILVDMSRPVWEAKVIKLKTA